MRKAIIVVHEIYGRNKHMQAICDSFTVHGFDVLCPNLIKREPYDYSEEDAAYKNFMENVGFTKASEEIKQLAINLKNTYEKVFVIGYSVGATIAWLCSVDSNIDGVVAYYGSHIRNYSELMPNCPTLLFFPEEETAFNVDELIAILTKKQITVGKLSGQHGFSDPYSASYNKQSAQTAFNEMIPFLSQK